MCIIGCCIIGDTQSYIWAAQTAAKLWDNHIIARSEKKFHMLTLVGSLRLMLIPPCSGDPPSQNIQEQENRRLLKRFFEITDPVHGATEFYTGDPDSDSALLDQSSNKGPFFLPRMLKAHDLL